MPAFVSQSVAETEHFGERLARSARSGTVFALSGDLGAGKTALVRGLARGLEADVRVHSPTYSLINIYSGGRLTIYHLDLYRLEGTDEIAAAGLEEYLSAADGVAVVEWAERWEFPANIRPRVRQIRMRSVDENVREIIYDDLGS